MLSNAHDSNFCGHAVIGCPRVFETRNAAEGGLLMLIFVRSNPRLTNMLFCVYGVVAMLLMLVRLPVA